MGDDLLDDFIRANRERSLGLYGIHLYCEGSPPVERRVRSEDRVNLYSVAKTFTSVALGLAEAEARLTLDDRLLDHQGSGKVVLRGSSGWDWVEAEQFEGSDVIAGVVA